MIELTFTLVVFAGWVLSVCLHEFGHAVVAYFGGDTSVKDKGYLTLNPLKYTNPTLSFTMPLIFLLLGGIPLPGAAVYINKRLLKSRLWDSAVSAAGPAATLIVALLLAAIVRSMGLVGSAVVDDLSPFAIDVGGKWLPLALTFLLTLEVAALVLNLLPIPGLDGYGILEPWLPATIRVRMKKVKRYGFIALFAAFWLIPAFNGFFWGLVNTIVMWLGIPPESGFLGYSLFRKGAEFILIGLIVILVIVNQVRKRQAQKGAQTNQQNASQPPPTEAELDQILEEVDETLAILPKDYDALEQKGRILLIRQQFEAALPLIEKAIHVKPQSFQAWFLKGIIQFETQHYSAAIETFTHALSIKSNHPSAAYNLACAQARLGQIELALESIKPALENDAALRTKAQDDPDLEGLRSHPDFQGFLKS